MPTTYFQKANSNNPYKNYGGTALHAGNVNTGQPVTGRYGNMTYNLTLSVDCYRVGEISGRIQMPTGVASSGNTGVVKALPTFPTFGKNAKGAYVGMVINTQIAGSGSTLLRSPSNDGIKKNGFTLTAVYTHRIFNILSWNYLTGAATKGGNAGSGITFLPDSGALLTAYAPGRLFYQYGALAKADNYKRTTNW